MATEEAEHYARRVDDYTKRAIEILKKEGEQIFMAKAKEPEGHPELKDNFHSL